MAKDQGRDTEQGGYIAKQCDIGRLEDGPDTVPGNGYPAGPDKDDADAGKIGPSIAHVIIPLVPNSTFFILSGKILPPVSCVVIVDEELDLKF
jgi:hypothetical protein